MIVQVEGFVHQGDEAIKSWVTQDGQQMKSRTAVMTTNDESPGHISFYCRGEKVDQYPLKIGQKVLVTLDERDSKNDRGFWVTNRRLIEVDYL